jgi:hypothetical protein
MMARILLSIACALVFACTLAVREASAVTTTPSSTTWVCAGGETDFTPSFSFVTYQHVSVELDSVPLVIGTDYTWFDADTIRLVVACSAAETLAMVRDSDPSNPVVTFTSGSRLSANLLNDALLQNIYAMEEIEENTLVQGMAKSGGHWDAASLRIQNCADAVGDTDVACWGQLTIANADLYPGTATDNKLIKGNGTAYVEGETLPDAAAGDATKMVQVSGANALQYGPKFPTLSGQAEKMLTVNASEDGFDYDTIQTNVDAAMATWAPLSASDSDTTSYTNLSVTIAVPATGTWDIEVHAVIVADGTNANGRWESCINENIDAGGATAVVCAGTSEANEVSVGAMDSVVNYYLRGATGGSSYVYTITMIDTNESTELPGTNCTDRGCHKLWAKAVRRL